MVVRTEREEAALLWRGLFAFTVVGLLGVATDLAMTRHWNGTVQMIPWFALAGLAVALVLVAVGVGIGAARVLAVAVAAASLFGVWEHLESNYDAGPLDAVYGAKWDTMSELSRWWTALTQGAGPSPTIVPGTLALMAASVVVLSVVPRRLGRTARSVQVDRAVVVQRPARVVGDLPRVTVGVDKDT